MRVRERILLERFEYEGFQGCRCFCDLELLFLSCGRVVAIATEREDNPGTSITNVVEGLASLVCDRFGIDPGNLVWIEHYGYPGASEGTRERTFDLVTFARSSHFVGMTEPCDTQHFRHPTWGPMRVEDWYALGLTPRASHNS